MDKNNIDSLSSETEKENLERAQKELDHIRAYKATFKSLEGRRVLKDMMESCFFTHSIMESTPDPILLSYNEGKRSVILKILKVLNMDEEMVLKFLNNDIENQESINEFFEPIKF